jgi:hypothetical protein
MYKRYNCYTNIGLKIKRGREFCELHNPKNPRRKYQCIDQELKGVPKGAEYCYFTYRMPQDYEARFACLEQEGIEKDSEYCRIKYDDIQRKTPELYKEAERWECYNLYYIPNGLEEN